MTLDSAVVLRLVAMLNFKQREVDSMFSYFLIHSYFVAHPLVVY